MNILRTSVQEASIRTTRVTISIAGILNPISKVTMQALNQQGALLVNMDPLRSCE